MHFHNSTKLRDGSGNPISSLSGAIDVHGADPHRIVYNQYIHYDTATTTTLAVAASSGDSQITLTSAVGFAVGDEIKLENGSQEPIFPIIKVLAGTLATLDTPVSFDHPIGTTVTKIYTNLAQAGLTTTASISAPVIFTSHVPSGTVVHLTGMSVVMTDTSAMDFTTFGGTTALTNGCVLAATSNGTFGTYTNWKRNLDLNSDAFPVQYQSKVGGGEFGLSAIYNIKSSTDSIVYLNGTLGDMFEVIVQDDLTALTNFKIKLQGHYEGT